MLIASLYWIASCWGILSLLGCTLAFSPAIANMFNYLPDNNRLLFKISHWGLILAVFSGLSHGLLMTQKNNINFYDLRTYWVYGEGVLTFNLLIFLAFSFGEIKLDRQKFLYLVYALLFLVGCHLSAAALT